MQTIKIPELYNVKKLNDTEWERMWKEIATVQFNVLIPVFCWKD
jgi:hypothetical protein